MSQRCMSQTISTLLFAAFLLSAGPAAASPWTLPADELTLTMDQVFSYASNEYLSDGYYQEFPLDGSFRSQTMTLGARYGFTDRFEGAMQFNVSHVTYSADPLILEEFDEAPTGGEATDSILNFNSSQFGAADLFLSARYNLHEGPVMVTSATTAKLPTGYEEPAPTFTTGPDGEQRVGGQATLGDAQSDLMQSLLVGTVVQPTGTFVRAELGGRYRFGAPGHQAFADVRAGQHIGDSLIFIAGVTGNMTLMQGEVIGETLIARDASVPAAQFDEDNIRSEDLRLDRNNLDGVAGLLLALGDIELTANYYYTFWGRNTAATHAFTVGTIFSLPDVTGR